MKLQKGMLVLVFGALFALGGVSAITWVLLRSWLAVPPLEVLGWYTTRKIGPVVPVHTYELKADKVAQGHRILVVELRLPPRMVDISGSGNDYKARVEGEAFMLLLPDGTRLDPSFVSIFSFDMDERLDRELGLPGEELFKHPQDPIQMSGPGDTPKEFKLKVVYAIRKNILEDGGLRIQYKAYPPMEIKANLRRKDATPSDPRQDSLNDGEDLSVARSRFATRLGTRGPAPQAYKAQEPPPGVKQVEYLSGGLKLKGWLSADPKDGKRRPAIVYLHGGWAFGREDWQDAKPFVNAGFVLFMPMLRGENGNPGVYESFYGEVNDAIAAGDYVATIPYVDEKRIFVAGHSVGAVLTVLTAMMPSPYRAAAALSAYLDMGSWAATSPANLVPYPRTSSEEIRLRNPMAFISSLRCPLTLFVEPDMRPMTAPFIEGAKAFRKKCEMVVIPGNHMTMVAPAVRKAIERFRR